MAGAIQGAPHPFLCGAKESKKLSFYQIGNKSLMS
jgi:hypothetical protein